MEHVPFSTKNVESNAKSTIRRIQRETQLDIKQLENLLKNYGVWK